MKERWQKIFNIISLVLLLVCVVKINWMNNEITNLKNTVNNEYHMLQNSIDSISSSVRYEMEQANNILSDSGFNSDGLNIKDKTAAMSCYVVPKVYNPDKTVAAIICNGEEIPMTLEKGRYTAKITIPVFEDCTIDNVLFKEDGTIRTQQLNWRINPRYDLVPTAFIHYMGERRQNYEGAKITRSYKGSVEIDFEHKGFGGKMKDAEVVILVNGKEQWRCKPVLEEVQKDDYVAIYIGDIDYSFDVLRGDTVKMYAEITDENGWKYHSVLEDITISEKGNPIPNNEYEYSEADIYDAEGNLLFSHK